MQKDKTNRREFMGKSAAGVAGFAAARLASPRRILGANDRIQIGLIGCGDRGTNRIRRAHDFAEEFTLDFTAICDVWRPQRERVASTIEEWSGRKPFSCSRYAELLSRDDVDAVIIATPDHAHSPILADAARAGKDVYCEKPMAVRLEDAIDAVDTVRAKKCVVQVGTQRRSDGHHIAGAELVRSGILGEISEVETCWHDSRPRWARDYSDVKQEDVDWEQYLMYLPPRPFDPRRFRAWHLFKGFTLGTPGLVGSHMIDIGTWYMDDPLPSSGTAHGGVYVWKDGREHADTIECLFEYPKGFLLTYSTRLANSKTEAFVILYGTRGTMYTYPDWYVTPEGGHKEDHVQEQIKIEAAAGTSHMKNWLECLRSRNDPNAPVEAGYAHSLASMLAYRSWETGRRQVYDSVNREIRDA